MQNNSLTLVFISNHRSPLNPLWQILTTDYQCEFADSLQDFELHSAKKNGCIYL